MPVATHQLALTLWTFLAFALDAIAIAAQAITGRHLGAGDVAATRAATRRMIQWGLWGGAVPRRCSPSPAPLLGPLFTGDAAVHDLLVPVLLVVGLGQPLSGLVFVLDGVLIGAGDGTYLAKAGLVMLAALHPGRAAGRRPRRRARGGLGRVHRRPDGLARRRCWSTASAATPGWSPASAPLPDASESVVTP